MWTIENLTTLADTRPHELVPIVLDLQARLSLNSQNSSKPSATDGYAKPAPKSLRISTGLKSGRQPGHPGRTLQRVERPDHTVIIPLDICPTSSSDTASAEHARGHCPSFRV